MSGKYDSINEIEEATETFFIRIESSMKDFYWTSLYNNSYKLYFSEMGIDTSRGELFFNTLTRVEALEGEFPGTDTFIPKIYYTTADNFFLK